ncbi:MAG: hypothetical protein NT148_01095 [Candidatus Nealsonbacteria bacterium]|nr:hypothetical protein [Candidatus Nealsonbacteria bacterium]
MENDKDIGNIIKKALEEIKHEKGTEVKGKCLTDIEKCSLIDGRVPKELRDVFLDHILSCKKCAQELKADLAILENIEKDTTETPEEWIQDTLKLVSRKPPYQPESGRTREKELVTSMPPSADRNLYSYEPPSLMINNFRVSCPPFARGGRTSAPPRIIKKIYFNCNHNCYVYLFEIREKTIKVILQKQKFLKKAKNELTGKIKKTLAVPKKGRLVLIFTRKTFKDVSSVKKIMLLIPGVTPIKLANMLRQEDHNVVVKVI